MPRRVLHIYTVLSITDRRSAEEPVCLSRFFIPTEIPALKRVRFSTTGRW